MTVHQRIREARNGIGMSSNKLADKVGVSSTAAWNWEHERTTPRPEQLTRIAAVLGVSVEWLLTGHGALQEGSIAFMLEETKEKIADVLKVPLEKIRLDLVVSA